MSYDKLGWSTPKPRAGEHTKGPWRTHDALVFFPDSAGGFSLQNCPASEANARRIVACVNACEGIPTASLEIGDTKQWIKEEISLRAERDLLRERERELVEALEMVAHFLEPRGAIASLAPRSDASHLHRKLHALLSKHRR